MFGKKKREDELRRLQMAEKRRRESAALSKQYDREQREFTKQMEESRRLANREETQRRKIERSQNSPGDPKPGGARPRGRKTPPSAAHSRTNAPKSTKKPSNASRLQRDFPNDGKELASRIRKITRMKMKPCKIEPTWSVDLNTPTLTNQEADIDSLCCDKHLATYQKQVMDFNLFIQEVARLASDSNEQGWRLSFSTKWFARKISRATWVEASLTDIHGKKTSSADREMAIKIFVCQGQVNWSFQRHVITVKNYFFGGGWL